MPEGTIVLLPQDWTTWLIFYLLGFLGVVIKFGKEMLTQGTSLSVAKDYIRAHGLVIVLHFITYTGLIAMWLTTDVFALAGGYKGILNGMTVVFGYAAQMMFDKAVPKLADRWAQKASDGTATPTA
jgi:hypothetical protein